jgi:hypothetical protein
VSAYTKFSDRFEKSELRGGTPAKAAKAAKVTPIGYAHIKKLDKTSAGLAALAGGWGQKPIFEKDGPSALPEAAESPQPEDEPAIWQAGLARLDPDLPPRDVPPRRWRQLIADCARLHSEGVLEKAARLGWTALDLFGCDNSKPFARIDQMGLIWLICGWRVVMISADAAILEAPTGSRQTFRRKPGEPGRRLVWELTRQREESAFSDGQEI